MSGFKPGKTTKAIIATVITSVLFFGTADASLIPHRLRTVFRDRAGNMMIVRSKCLRHEDSAAHLRLILFSRPLEGPARTIYTCHKRGF